MSRVEYDAALKRVREALWDVERRPQRGPYLTTAERLTLAALDLKGPPTEEKETMMANKERADG